MSNSTKITAGILEKITKREQEIYQMLEELTKREQEIIKLYFGIDHDNAYTSEEIGKKFKITPERVDTIKTKALDRLMKSAGIQKSAIKSNKTSKKMITDSLNNMSKGIQNISDAYDDFKNNDIFQENFNKLFEQVSEPEQECIKKYIYDACRPNRTCSSHFYANLEKAIGALQDKVRKKDNNSKEMIDLNHLLLLIRVSRLLHDAPTAHSEGICSCLPGGPSESEGLLSAYCKIKGTNCPHGIRFDSWGIKTMKDIKNWNNKIKTHCTECPNNIDMLKCMRNES